LTICSSAPDTREADDMYKKTDVVQSVKQWHWQQSTPRRFSTPGTFCFCPLSSDQ